MIDFFKNLFSTEGFPARWNCGTWEAGHGWLHVISDTLIFGAYTAIPLTLVLFARKKHREILFTKLVWLFAIFILACGIGHLIEATIFWHPWYRFSGVVKAITAIASWATLFAVIRSMPVALSLPGLLTMNRRLEASLQDHKRSNQELQRSNEDLDQFAYVASHDLKAPLRSIRNLASWVEEDCEDVLPDESKQHLKQLHQRVDRLDTLMGDLLTYSKAGRDLSSPEEIEVTPLVREIVKDLGVADSAFKIEVADDLPMLTSWRVPFEQIVRNLLSNGLKHHGGESGTITVTGHRKGKNVYYTFKDDGQGIPAEFHERIFGMFQTLKSKDDVEGSGFGLAIVKKLIDRLEGTIHLESEEGEGAAFTIVLPVQPPQ